MSVVTRRACSLALLGVLLLAGCASPQRAAVTADGNSWAGRLALTVQERPAESFSAAFELRGNAQSGELTLLSPLGGTAAVLSWQPGAAKLATGSQVREFGSLQALVAQATGSDIPVAALFDWLRGEATQVPGWQVDLAGLGEGRISARRVEPTPVADLRVVLER